MKNWQKYAAIGMTAVLAAGLMTGCGSDKKTEQGASGEKNKIVIGLDDNFPPFGFHDESGELVGFDIDMAKEAAKASDRVIITSDNPRFEEPQDIINDMLAGLDAEDMRKTLSIADRKEAIRTACMLAEKGDVILVAGKGHENYQEIKGVKHHFDDKEVLKEIFN